MAQTYLDLYKIGLSINDRNFEIDPSYFSFSMRDNIFNLFNTATLSFKDKTGLFQEFFDTSEGAKVKLEFGDEDVINTCTYVNKYDKLDTTEKIGYLTGEVDFNLINFWYNSQYKISRAHNKRISNIIRDFAGQYQFKSKDIDDTGNQRTWYQPYMTNAKFITDMLLPNCFSRNADQTPFFAFITNDNVFHFRNYKSMTDEELIGTVDFKINIDKISRGEDSFQNKTSSLKRIHQNSDKHFYLRHRNLFRIDKEDGTIKDEEDHITDHPTQNNLKIPILNDEGNTIDFKLVGFTKDETGEKENQFGRIFYDHRDSLFLDQFIFIQPFNPKFQAGKNIQLNVYTTQNEGSKLSKRFSSRYLIIDCEHIWDSETQKGYTKVIIAKKYVQVPESYLLKPDLL